MELKLAVLLYFLSVSRSLPPVNFLIICIRPQFLFMPLFSPSFLQFHSFSCLFFVFTKGYVEEVLGGSEKPTFMDWVQKKKRGRIQDRILVIGEYRVFSIKKG